MQEKQNEFLNSVEIDKENELIKIYNQDQSQSPEI